MEEKDYVILRSYRSVWKHERKIHSIEGIKLLFPVSPNEVIYFGVSLLIAVGLTKVVPFLDRVHFIVKYAALPFALMKFLTKQTLDGKMPHKFFFEWAVFLLSPKKLARFKPIQEGNKVRFITPVIMRDMEIKNKTNEALRSSFKSSKSRYKLTLRKEG